MNKDYKRVNDIERTIKKKIWKKEQKMAEKVLWLFWIKKYETEKNSR